MDKLQPAVKTLIIAVPFFFLALVLLYFYQYRYKGSLRLPVKLPEQQVQIPNVASLSLEASSERIEVGEGVTVSIYLDTGDQNVDGVDVILEYNPDVLDLDNIAPNDDCQGPEAGACFQAFAPITDEVVDGTDSPKGIFDQVRVKDCADTGSYAGGECTRGQIEFGGVTFSFGNPDNADDDDKTDPVNGSRVKIADLYFYGLGQGLSDISFLFTVPDNPLDSKADNTLDSNVAAHTQDTVDDVLASATGVSIGVGVDVTATPTNIPGACQEDIDGNGVVNLADLNLIINFNPWGGACSACQEDIDGNGVVNLADLNLIINFNPWGGACPQ